MTDERMAKLDERAGKTEIDLGMGGCERWVNGDEMVIKKADWLWASWEIRRLRGLEEAK